MVVELSGNKNLCYRIGNNSWRIFSKCITYVFVIDTTFYLWNLHYDFLKKSSNLSETDKMRFCRTSSARGWDSSNAICIIIHK